MQGLEQWNGTAPDGATRSYLVLGSPPRLATMTSPLTIQTSSMPSSTVSREKKLKLADEIFETQRGLLATLLENGDIKSKEGHDKVLKKCENELKKAREEALTGNYDLSCRYNPAKLRAPP